MIQPEPQQRMPSEKSVLFLFMLVCSLVLFVIAWHSGIFNDDRLDNTLVSVATTLFIVSLVELIPELIRRLLNKFRKRKFSQLFGDAVFKDHVRLVFGKRDLKPKIMENPFVTYYTPLVKAGETKPTPEGINGWLAFQDVQAAAYITNVIAEMTGNHVLTVHDKDIENDPKLFCIVSFGLGFNKFTHFVADYFDTELYAAKTGKSDKSDLITDNFFIEGQPVLSSLGHDIAIVARIVPPAEKNKPLRAWFICAGRTATGTAAAGYFLASHWEKIHELYLTEDKSFTKDSLVVVIEHTEFKEGNSGDTARTARILKKPDNKDYIAWGVAAGVEAK